MILRAAGLSRDQPSLRDPLHANVTVDRCNNDIDAFIIDVDEAHMTSPLSLIHISEPTRLGMISYAVFCLKKKKQKYTKTPTTLNQPKGTNHDKHQTKT